MTTAELTKLVEALQSEISDLKEQVGTLHLKVDEQATEITRLRNEIGLLKESKRKNIRPLSRPAS